MSRWWVVALLLSGAAQAGDWADMCELIYTRHGISCAAVEQPEIQWVRTLKNDGEYSRGNEILIARSLKGVKKHSTIVHEQVHYLLDALGTHPVPGYVSLICESERIAFDISNQYAIEIHILQQAEGGYMNDDITYWNWMYWHDFGDPAAWQLSLWRTISRAIRGPATTRRTTSPLSAPVQYWQAQGVG